MKTTLTFFVFAILFFILFGFYNSGIFDNTNTENIFLTLSTFLFALFSGFITARQSSRYGEIRSLSARFDGNISALFRLFSHFGETSSKEAAVIAKKHAEAVLSKGWDYPLVGKTSTITDFHALLTHAVERDGTDGVKNGAIGQIFTLLREMQAFRKQMVALHRERVPGYQWGLLYLLAFNLLLTVSILPSEGLFVSSVVKSSFVITVFVVLILLQRLDKLALFSSSLGEESARDIREIIEGTR